MIFLDNFSKNISNRMFRADLGAYTSCQWTGRAIHPFVQEPGYACPSGEVKEISGAIVPAMPPDLDSTFSFDRILSVRTLSSSAHGTLWYCSLYPRKVLGILGTTKMSCSILVEVDDERRAYTLYVLYVWCVIKYY